MTIWTVHFPDPATKGNALPRVIPEQFSIPATLLGPLWLGMRQAVLPAMILLAGWMLLVAFLPPLWQGPVFAGLMVAQGLFAQDLRRWSLTLSGYRLAGVLVAADADTALSMALARMHRMKEKQQAAHPTLREQTI
ncbi:hypothetical protein [Granulibacter bethesdensis]|uniref:hypothetical protein n=1 Tax=Granulibacter bethesdensis TaxID=364410 RepID=UPI00093310C9|nr:hypothetical protein [Granulibacter bethesdensis]